MVSLSSAVLVATVGTLSLISGADAFWRMPCRARTGLARLDPLVYPGGISDHSHVIHGGNNFGMDTKATDLKKSECTSCGVTQDKSAYWTPSLHFMFKNGTTVVVPQIGGMLAYYLLYGNNYDGSGKITAFPDGFQMLAGDMNLRNFSNLPVPDPPTYQWTPEESTQSALRQKAVGFNCMNYQRAPEPTLYRHFLPDKSYLDANCANGIRLELMFPSCWNGKDLDSPDHKSHVAYPGFVMTGTCPEGYDVKLPSLLYETIWDTYSFRDADGQFMLSYGDPTGYGYHGDFMMGWDSVDFLQKAVDTCTNLSGNIQDCPIFDIQSDYTASECKFEEPSVLKDDRVAGPRDGLPINIPIQAGPGYASRYEIVGASQASSSIGSTSIPAPSSVPTLGYTPRPSSTEMPGLVSPAPSPAPVPTTSAAPAPAPAPALTPASVPTTSSYSAPPAPSTTAAPALPVSPDAVDALPIIGTSYVTNSNEVLEIVLVQKYVTVTEGAAPVQAVNGRRKRHLGEHKMHIHHHGAVH
ncbi:WSC domain-containing protein 2 [Sphaceloma murrayae]|uniref:WSC domain-containing protein 2 n=1 Tax=Sphaceloma murrayae TaxID=2082308 RepID=A0A2K1R1K7_9PEZI|nr:WSC domain-containing protein 2 [Sphaceloma murrayae]